MVFWATTPVYSYSQSSTSGSHANTTFTIHALAERTSDLLADDWGSIAG